MNSFRFIDLFSGIGGFHLAMHNIGGTCVFASEIDESARKTYQHNFYKYNPEVFENGLFNDDIRKIVASELPDFDVLCAGFPCQPFSQAGYKRGFSDNHASERGSLFFNIAEIIDAKKPKAFFLENVRGLVNHDNGKTFKTIRKILEEELGYSFYFKVVHASDYGLPQLRPRVFMIGFRDEAENALDNFKFPPKQPLKFNMSDVWNGKCSREIGFTLRVGGRGSKIDDRRNWDAYLVNGEVRRLMPEQGRIMQGFPSDFEFPVARTQAMKQLGNTVAVDAVQACGQALIDYLSILDLKQLNGVQQDMQNDTTKNKGEWSEIYSFLKLINDKKILLADKNLDTSNNSSFFRINKVSTLNIAQEVYLNEDNTILVQDNDTEERNRFILDNIVNDDVLANLFKQIKAGKKTFSIQDFDIIQSQLGLSIIKGGNSNQKADIVLDIENNEINIVDEGFGIKSYIGSKPTLLNASGNTNFIYEVSGLNSNIIDTVNSIDTRTKLKDRLQKIIALGGKLSFSKVEKETMQYNLEMVDSNMPKIISEMLLEFYNNRTNKIAENIANLQNEDSQQTAVKIKRLLVAVLLGFFAGKKWDGRNVANGTIIVKATGEQVGLHIIELSNLEDYLFENIKFDTPSTSRHRYGSLYIENDGKIYFKLNMQLRF